MLGGGGMAWEAPVFRSTWLGDGGRISFNIARMVVGVEGREAVAAEVRWGRVVARGAVTDEMIG